jgi:RNA polymerase sigma factor (sigma-70 family)
MTSPSSSPDDSSPAAAAQFATTHWTDVLAAGGVDSPQRARALEQLCTAYWYPLYAFVRRQGHSPADAQDLTQEFFGRLLAMKYLEGIQTGRGRFRSFLLTAMKHFLCDERDRANAQKRGGGQRLISLDEQTAEGRYRLEPQTGASPEKLYDRRWALTLLERALERLREEHVMAGKGDMFDQLRGFITGDRAGTSYAELAGRRGMTEGAVKMTVTRMRQRYRELLRAEIAQTVENPADIDEEMRYLAAILQN